MAEIIVDEFTGKIYGQPSHSNTFHKFSPSTDGTWLLKYIVECHFEDFTIFISPSVHKVVFSRQIMQQADARDFYLLTFPAARRRSTPPHRRADDQRF